jgi:hypothetical protein
MSDYRGLIEEMEKEELKDKSKSFFPALVEVDSTLKILDHPDLPVGVSFRIVETGPLTPEKVLAACLRWTSAQIRVAVDDVLRD